MPKGPPKAVMAAATAAELPHDATVRTTRITPGRPRPANFLTISSIVIT